jgi:hypothetical protein
MKSQIILAIDFDETIVYSHPFPKIKGFRKGAAKYLHKLYQKDYYIIIWTCRTDKPGECNDQTDAMNFLKENMIPYHLFNDNHPALQKRFKNNCRKIAVDFYVDDKNLWLLGVPSWFFIYWLIRLRSFFLKPDRYILAHCKPEDYL